MHYIVALVRTYLFSVEPVNLEQKFKSVISEWSYLVISILRDIPTI